MNVPLADLHAQYLTMKPEIDLAIKSVIDSSQFILGKSVADFEGAFAAAHGARHCIAVGSGTDALHVSLWALGIGRGDAVITTPFTFIATTEAISLCGGQPLFVDIDPRTFTMSPEKLGELLSGKNIKIGKGLTVKGVIPVHLYGQAAAMDELLEITKTYQVEIIEDACQAHLATYDGKYVGSFGATACFSFYPGKNLGAYGEAGAVITNDDALALKMRRLRDHGQVEKYKHDFWGHNYRMDGIQGAVLGVKLRNLSQWTARRRSIAATYKKLLSGVGDIVLPHESPKAHHVYHLFVVRTKRRSALQQFLSGKQIATSIAYPIPLHFQQAYRHLGYRKGDFPVSETVADECLSLPVYPEMTDEQVEYVVSSIREFFRD
ncbi:MAG: DegT/DnrJ/EryC1/StrS family aminotransferase [Ignavibacteria bacterium]|nr:DegT/DnrJ/EryC1/StrS family aminotransferase [Ignavibacteria bacterium]MBI3765316.1 DegT/DnrJ/EryC1/StrS family aminotransferase [Ignavibacteriales bacterium]